MLRSIVISLLAGLVALTGVAVTSARSTSALACGDTITVDTTLEGDLLDCSSNGLVIGADGITLDLNGHTISGDGESVGRCPRREICDVGIANDGHDGVTLRNGSVSGFASGVLVGQARRNHLLKLAASRNEFFGFVIVESTQSVVRGSSGDDNPEPDGDGIAIFGSHGLRIVGNFFRRNALGMHVEDSENILIARNRFARNAHMGILMEAGGNRVLANRCVRNRECIVVSGDRNVVAANRSARGMGGIAIENGHGNLVARNVVANARWDGIRLGITKPPIGGGRNIARANLVRGGRDGFLVAKEDRGSLLRGNVAIGAADDGFDVRGRSARLTANRALRNDDLGIEAVGGVLDGGGNVARRSGDPRGCTGITCGR